MAQQVHTETEFPYGFLWVDVLVGKLTEQVGIFAEEYLGKDMYWIWISGWQQKTLLIIHR